MILTRTNKGVTMKTPIAMVAMVTISAVITKSAAAAATMGWFTEA
jgi:hypothetical protein